MIPIKCRIKHLLGIKSPSSKGWVCMWNYPLNKKCKHCRKHSCANLPIW